MTPRSAVRSGLPGIGQSIFPESAKQAARNIGLKDGAAQVYRNEPEDDGGGDFNDKWKPHGKPVDGRIDAVGRKGMEQIFGEKIDETTAHVATLEPGVDVTTDDRIEIGGVMWTIEGKAKFTDAATTRLAVKELLV